MHLKFAICVITFFLCNYLLRTKAKQYFKSEGA